MTDPRPSTTPVIDDGVINTGPVRSIPTLSVARSDTLPLRSTAKIL